MTDLRILIVADDALVRAGLSALLSDQPGFFLVGRIAGEDILSELDIFQPEIILWDLGWNPEETLQQGADLSEANLPIVALLPDDSFLAEAWGIGIRGFLSRDVVVESLLTALTAVAQNFVLFDPTLTHNLLSTSPEIEEPMESLTPRESEVLQLLSEGLANKVIAQRLDISTHTVKFHMNAIFGKLGVQSRTEAVVRATRLGLVSL